LLVILRRHVVFRDLLRADLGYVRVRRIFDTGDVVGFEGLAFFS
jgi:hypothetical protein